MYKLKSIARRTSALVAAFAVFAGTGSVFLMSAATYADALNPLTERSLTLSSSSPGWADTDGSGNSTYAPPNSGANGQKTGNYFSFKVSTDSSIDANSDGSPDNPIKAMSFQYCTKSAGDCAAPGNNSPLTGSDTDSTSDLSVNYSSATEVASGDFTKVVDTSTGLVKAVPGYTNENPKYQSPGGNATGANGTGDPAEAAKNVTGNFIVMHYNGTAWVLDTGWTITTSNQEEASSQTTGKQNTIILQNSAGLGLPSTTPVKVLFFANATQYITNPGIGAFFVKINTFKNFNALTTGGTPNTLADNVASGDVIDGGVTVANVMNQSIQITTKVLETMQFSVGTVDPDTLASDGTNTSALYAANGHTRHTSCDIIQTGMTTNDQTNKANVLQLGSQIAESSLETDKAYATHSYWRLSSNSSAGATVYYSGHTLSNTSGDEITPIGTSPSVSVPGSEQFGLAIATATLSGAAYNTANYGVNYAQDRDTDKDWENAADNGKTSVDSSVVTDLSLSGTLNPSYHTPRLDPLVPKQAYSGGSGAINSDSLSGLGTNEAITPGTPSSDAAFAFDPMSDTVPAPIATENTQVVDCVTAKMRYVGNIAATTPAGIYTTKINYIAAPQY
jgi:hypothetical protein